MRRKIATTQSPLWADPADVAELAKEMTVPQLQCRDFGHARGRSTARWVSSLNCYERVLRCAHGCGTEWVQLVALNGEILDSKIRYADGYLLAPGTGRMDKEGRNAVRVEAMRREVQAGNVESAPDTPRVRKRSRGN